MPKSTTGELNKELGLLVRQLRTSHGLTLQELARMLGISHQQLQKYEKGTNQISAARLNQIAKLLKAPAGHFSKFFVGDAENGSGGSGGSGPGSLHEDGEAFEGPPGPMSREELMERVAAIRSHADAILGKAAR